MKKARKLLAVLLCLTMCFSLLPTWAFAEEAEPEETAATEVIAEEAEEAQVVETPAEPDGETPADTENAMQEDA